MRVSDDQKIIVCRDPAEWEDWLAANHEGSTGVWLKIAKKHSGRTTVSITDALDVALCYGWIDGIRRSHDEDHYLQRYLPRRPNSHWSKVNVAKVESLIAAGRMRASGLAQVEAAKADGRWAGAYESQKNAKVPADLAAALEQNSRARSYFEQLGKSDRYQVILPLLKAKTPKSRTLLLDKTISMLEAGEMS